MAYLSPFQRCGPRRLIEDSLRIKFGEVDLGLISDIAELTDSDEYFNLNRIILKAKSLREVRRAVPKAKAREHWEWEVENNKRGRWWM